MYNFLLSTVHARVLLVREEPLPFRGNLTKALLFTQRGFARQRHIQYRTPGVGEPPFQNVKPIPLKNINFTNKQGRHSLAPCARVSFQAGNADAC